MAGCTANDIAGSSPVVYSVMAIKYLDIILAIVAVIGNSVCIVTFMKTRSLHSPSNFLVGALCASDLLVGLIVHPFYLAMLAALESSSTPFEDYWRRMDFVFFLFGGFSVYLAYFVTLDRYLAICFPLRYYNLVTIKRYAFLTVSAFIFSWPGAIISQYYNSVTYFGTAMIFCIFIQFGVFYSLIYKAIRQQRNRITVLGRIEGENDTSIRKQKEESNKAYTIGIILVIFFVCYIPSTIVTILHTNSFTNLCSIKAAEIKMYIWSQWFFLFSSSINPIVYSLKSQEFRRAIKRLFCRGLLSRLSDSDSGGNLSVQGKRQHTDSS